MNKFWRSLFAGLLAACGTFGFAMDDLTTWKTEMASLTGVAYGGVGAVG